MAPLDLALLLIFSAFAAGGLLATVLCVRAALRAAVRPDGELRMVAWTVGALVGLTVAGVSAAYILLPILAGL